MQTITIAVGLTRNFVIIDSLGKDIGSDLEVLGNDMVKDYLQKAFSSTWPKASGIYKLTFWIDSNDHEAKDDIKPIKITKIDLSGIQENLLI